MSEAQKSLLYSHSFVCLTYYAPFVAPHRLFTREQSDQPVCDDILEAPYNTVATPVYNADFSTGVSRSPQLGAGTMRRGTSCFVLERVNGTYSYCLS